jgi:two-component system sensor kinase FixL
MPANDSQRHDDYIRHYMTTGERRIIGVGRIVSGKRRDGTEFPVELTIGEASNGEHRIFTGFIRDLTEQQQAELRLKELQSELIHVSRVSAMGTMASTLAHELNQPLAAIANYLESARDLLGHPDENSLAMVQEAVDEGAKEALRAGHIVRRLRDFVARREIEQKIFSLSHMIEEAARLALIGASEHGVRSFFKVDAQTDAVVVDRVQIQQVLVNLLRNAVEAMAGQPVRDITVSTCPDVNGMVRVTVADTGPGIDPEIELFEAFSGTKGTGMGLGLSICRTIVEAHGGRIWAEPRKTGGTQFSFTVMSAENYGHNV